MIIDESIPQTRWYFTRELINIEDPNDIVYIKWRVGKNYFPIKYTIMALAIIFLIIFYIFYKRRLIKENALKLKNKDS